MNLKPAPSTNKLTDRADLSWWRRRVIALERELRGTQTQARQIEQIRKLGRWEVNLSTDTVLWSEGTYQIFGLTPDEPITLAQTHAFYPAESLDTIAASIKAAKRGKPPFDITVPYHDVSGTPGWVRIIGQRQSNRDRGVVVGVIEDVTDEKEAQELLKSLAFKDTLTGIANRRSFEERLEQITGDTSATLLLIDIDHFKAFNDTFGHPEGDKLLKSVGERLLDTLRPDDFAARLGGDEFAVIVDGLDTRDDLDRVVARITGALTQIAPTTGGVTPSVSIGVSHSRHAIGPSGLLKSADLALYRAKSLGRDTAEIYCDALATEAEKNADMVHGVRRALAENQMTVVYQPIVDLRSGIVRGMEALVRWNHPQHGLLAPADFAAAFDDPIVAIAIDDFVLGEALAQLRTWLDTDVPVPVVNVNCSDAQLRRPDLVDRIEALLRHHRLEPHHLKLEVVETAFAGRDIDQVRTTLEALSDRGVVSTLDDFGTGHASLIHLKTFRVERIKIDRSFIENITTCDFDRGLTKSLIDLGRNLKIRITAEGVETDDQLKLLREFDCDCAQGYLIGRPTPPQAANEVIDMWHARAETSPATTGICVGKAPATTAAPPPPDPAEVTTVQEPVPQPRTP